MKRWIVLAGILGAAAAVLLSPVPAVADSLGINIGPDHVRIGIDIGEPPRLVVVPGTRVYGAPAVPYNYFFYGGKYYLFHEGVWHHASSYNGPWVVIGLERVPRPVLLVPVEHYKDPPGHWRGKHGPPPWAPAKGYRKKWEDDD